MKVRYIVHSCERQAYQMPVKVGDNEIVASVDGLVIELVSEDKSMSHTIRCQPADILEVQEAYARGTVVDGDFNPVSE